MSIISVRTTDDEKELIKTYADFLGMSVSDFVKTSVIEKIEDIFDLKTIEAYEKKLKNDDIKTYSLADVKKKMGL